MTATDDKRPKYDHAGRRLPDFFIAGHAKSGTTALYEMLRLHPEIFMPQVKEPRFLAEDVYVRPERSGSHLPRTLDEYLALFAPARADQLAGEASPLYLLSRTAAAAISEMNRDSRIVVILREPASFLRSLHMQFVQSHVENRNDLLEAVNLDDERRAGRGAPKLDEFVPQVLVYSDHVRYVEQLERFHAALPAEQLLVLIYDDFRADNEATVARVLRHLGVDDTVPVAPKEANPTVRMRSRRLHDLVHAVSVGRDPASRAAKRAIKAVTPGSVRQRALHTTQHQLIAAPPAPPDERVMRELRRRFKDEVVALSDYIDRDLVSEWGYDRL
jgi:hypothetical protein